ncbi:MAG: hypothetical protein JSS57_00190 [Proteobacteria bacterium]|nr:hypothetical protein [Pseudomonadota bacterium]
MPHGIYPAELAEMMKAHAGEKYRPSNGTEGEIFIGSWCGLCAVDMRSCKIVEATFNYEEDAAEYPAEWKIGVNGQPLCAAYRNALDEPVKPRCPATVDMFQEASHADA